MAGMAYDGRPPRGGRGLKRSRGLSKAEIASSPSARGARIETMNDYIVLKDCGRPPRGGRGLKLREFGALADQLAVALRAGGAD